MEENNRDYDERREFRHKRRVRNQIIAYVSVAVTLVLVLTGVIVGVMKISKSIADKKQAEELARQLEEMSKQAEEEVSVEPPEEVAEEPEPEKDLLGEIVDSCIAEMPLEDKVAGLFMVTPEAITGVDTVIKAGDGTREALSKYAVGGLIYFAKNIKSREQLTEMLANTVSMSKYPLFLGVDEEGGSVRRVGGNKVDVAEVGDMADVGASGDPAQAYSAGNTMGVYLKELGFNMDFAPVADVLTDPDNKTIGKRSFGSDVNVVSQMVPQVVAGLQDAGVVSCLKHFPGLGDTVEDTHSSMSSTERTLDDMRGTEFPAFKAGIEGGARLVMVSHLSAPNAVGDNTPCCLSGTMITDVLRGELGFDGVVVTDALNMGAIKEYYTSDQAAVMALQAGADLLLMPEDFEAAYQGVLTAVQDGTIPEERIDESLRRIYRIKYADKVDESASQEGQEAGAAEPEGDSEGNADSEGNPDSEAAGDEGAEEGTAQ